MEHAHRGKLYESPDPRTGLVLEPLRWITAMVPRWVVMEQVLHLRPVWHAYEHHLHTLGYATWSGVLNAADYGVPQTRKRAILIASLDRQPARPAPTHEQKPDGMFSLPRWVSMADAIGWPLGWATGQETIRGAGMTERHGERPLRTADQPCEVISGKSRSWFVVPTVSNGYNTMRTSRDVQDMVPYERPIDQPAPTLDGQAGSKWQFGEPGHRRPPMRWKFRSGPQANATVREAHEPASTILGSTDNGGSVFLNEDGTKRKLTVPEALALQSFRPDYPVVGTRTAMFQQIGDAIPPLLAEAVIAEVLGCP